MTRLTGPIKIERVHTLSQRIWIDGEGHTPSIHRLDVQGGALWATGEDILLRSGDGSHWQDCGANLRDEGSFFVSAVATGPMGLNAFARNRNGLRCLQWSPRDSMWRPLFDVPSAAAGVRASWTDRGLVALSEYAPDTDLIRVGSGPGSVPRKEYTLPGHVVHFQMTSSGRGIGVIRQVVVTEWSVESGPSTVLLTGDYGHSWREAAKLEAVLLTGVSTELGGVLVGGADGVIAAVDGDGLQGEWQEEGGAVVAVDVSGTCRAAVVESDDEPPAHRLLMFDGIRWVHREVSLGERVRGIKLVGGGFVICTVRSVFLGRLS
jgi:hypothetical protein